MVKIKLAAVALLVFTLSFRIWQTTGCRQFESHYFNPISIKINVESQVGVDVGVNRNIARFFHNKATTGIFEMTKSYISTLEPRFLLEILGPLGAMLVLVSATLALKKRQILTLVHLASLLAASSLLILPKYSKESFYLVALLWYGFSFWGIRYLMETRIKITLFIILVPLTLWYFTFSWQMPMICHEIFFN